MGESLEERQRAVVSHLSQEQRAGIVINEQDEVVHVGIFNIQVEEKLNSGEWRAKTLF